MDLLFKKDDASGTWISEFSSEGSGVVQLKQANRGVVSVRAGLVGMDKVVVGVYDNPFQNDVLFELVVPKGLEVRLTSKSKVIAARYEIV